MTALDETDGAPDWRALDAGASAWFDAPSLTAAADLGLAADPAALQVVRLAVDAVDVPAARALWAAVLGYEDDPRPHVTDLDDPRRLDPVVFFQEMDAADVERLRHPGRVRLELVVPEDAAHARVESALAAGARVVSDEAPGRWTLADPEGIPLDVVTPR